MHLRIHWGNKPCEYRECGKTCYPCSHLIKYRRLHNWEKLHNEAIKAFTQSSLLSDHQTASNGGWPSECNEYGKPSFRVKSFSIIRHFTGEKPYSWNECGKAFCSNGNLVNHQRVYTEKRPYEPNKHSKAFRQNKCLIWHQSLHTGEQVHISRHCGKAFSQNFSQNYGKFIPEKNNLARHLVWVNVLFHVTVFTQAKSLINVENMQSRLTSHYISENSHW